MRIAHYFSSMRGPNRRGTTNCTSSDTEDEPFFSRTGYYSLCSSTLTDTKLHKILTPYLKTLKDELLGKSFDGTFETKPLNIIVITDGVPTDEFDAVIILATGILTMPVLNFLIRFFRHPSMTLNEIGFGLLREW